MSDFTMTDDGEFVFGAASVEVRRPPHSIIPLVTRERYWQDRCAEAWANWRTSEASRAFLRRHACVVCNR